MRLDEIIALALSVIINLGALLFLGRAVTEPVTIGAIKADVTDVVFEQTAPAVQSTPATPIPSPPKVIEPTISTTLLAPSEIIIEASDDKPLELEAVELPPEPKPEPPPVEIPPMPMPAEPVKVVTSNPAPAASSASSGETNPTPANLPPPAGATDSPASARQLIKPTYPSAARRRGEEGEVTLEAGVDAKGRVFGIRVVRSSGFTDLDTAAIQSIKHTPFKPAKRGKKAIDSSIRLTVVFRLEDK